MRVTRKQVQKILQCALDEAGIERRTEPSGTGWQIDVYFRKLKDEVAGVEVDAQYRRAAFYFDLGQLTEECSAQPNPAEWLAEFVRHEVAHVLLAPLAKVAEALAGDDQRLARLVDEAHESATHAVTVLWCRLKGGAK